MLSFLSDYAYSGDAEVSFDDPPVQLRGSASVRSDDKGRPVIEVTVKHASCTIGSDFDVFAIIYGSHTLPGGGITVGIGGEKNRLRIRINTEDGVFCAGPDWNYQFSSVTPGEPLTLNVRPAKAEFSRRVPGTEQLLLLPLTNFFADLPSTAALTTLDGGEAPARCVSFEIDGKQAFIQRYPTVAESSSEDGPSPSSVITGIAVVPIVTSCMLDPWGWFISTFLRLLDFATGCTIGCPWFETRDESGDLLRRVHLSFGTPVLSRGGYGALTKAFHWADGDFLTAALSSAETREPFFGIALRHCISAGSPDMTMDDQLTHLVRGFECLTRRYGTGTQDLVEGLDSDAREKLDAILDRGTREIRALAAAVTAQSRSQILRIAERTRAGARRDKSFGISVSALAEKLGLHDEEVLESFYAAHPGPGGRNWVQTLSYYRGAVVHEGYLDLESPDAVIGDVLGFILHLHDLLTRILLRIIKYGGQYQPRLIRATAAETCDWFKPGVNVEGLLQIPTLGLGG